MPLGAGPRSQTAFPPRWKQSSMCHVCACAFSLVKRRHHCRNCGQSVCSQHSTNRVALPKFALSEAQRVCDQCFLSGHHMIYRVVQRRLLPALISHCRAKYSESSCRSHFIRTCSSSTSCSRVQNFMSDRRV
ncbi:putative FYVE zinc finger, Zinc finger, FYVE/PHD-type, Zinc finger, RING/FYVE/PHD-type [Plasmopara halstedii]